MVRRLTSGGRSVRVVMKEGGESDVEISLRESEIRAWSASHVSRNGLKIIEFLALRIKHAGL